MIKRNKITTALAITIASVTMFGSIVSYADGISEKNSNIIIDSRASSSSSETPAFPVSGVNYYGKTQISTNTVSKVAIATSIARTDKTVPSGRIGVHTALYREGTGTAITSSSWSYNNSSTKSHSINAYHNSPKAGNYRAQGTMKAYEEKTGLYKGKTLNTSAYLTYKNMNLTISDNEMQERVRMYETKDMIAAEGLSGKTGYISLTDMGIYENPSSPEEALRLQQERLDKYGEYRYINIYDTDGKTVIDKFRVSHI